MKRFWSKVNKQGPRKPHMRTRCWTWTAGCNSGGYGTFWFGKSWQAHRFVIFLLTGRKPLPEEEVAHKCDTPSCVRPSHLFITDHAGNMADAKDKCKFGNTRLYETANGQCKLSVANVRSIRRKYATGKWLQRELAAEYGVSQTLISAIIRRTRRRVLRYAKVKEDAA